MKRKRRGWILGLSALGIVSAGATGAYFSDQIAVVNEIRMGDVDISLEEFSLKDGKEIPYEDPKLVQPGDIVSKIPRITNLAEPCWIRVKVGYRNDKEELEGFRDEDLSGISAKWVRRGEYYYYTSVLEPSEAVDIFHNLQVPAYWDNEHAGQNLDVIVDAQAIQAVHFQPDFEAMSPWGNQEVEVCIHKESDRVERKQEIIAHKVEFNGAAHKLISVSDDFFSNFGTVMPGDTL
ncbi:MAG: hypothetical protein KBT01_01685 [Clostridiales bacterium]|nr:hypothetical protein [Candidatus Blautia equi]